MNNISTVISELLFERDSVIVPGLGMFIRHDDGAKVNVITNQFERPSASVEFDPQQRGEDGVLVKALATSMGCSEEESQKELTQFVADCFTDLKEGKTVSLPGLGTLSMDDHAGLGFIQEKGVNLNGDAFGLGDFSPTPVYVGKVSEDRKVPDDDDEDDEDDESFYHKRRRRSILWTILSLLLVIPAVLLLLVFFDVIRIDLPFKSKPPKLPQVYVPVDTSLLKYMAHYDPALVAVEDTVVDTIAVETGDTLSMQCSDTLPTLAPDTLSTQTPVVNVTKEHSINIIGGCFSQQENAEKLVTSLHDLGYGNAYVLKRGNMYYVSYGRYATLEEAKEGLAQIRSTTDNKAWILNK